MDITMKLLAWCLILNYGVLLLWFIALVLAKPMIYKMHSRWFDISFEQFNQMNYICFGFYKILVFVFNLAPYIGLKLIGY
ncbi:hypothetical protein LP316_07060 [Thalassotalea sp. LPB0316]|uniref:DUF6868 family protein n=1 Tax=Thalassotalea sp. LPB0316 TaxID=2769490 RepID=UPI0018689D3B|nr:hypothetical protein [Thalassotalea sp. LPB0316]QOL27041.1 hypothetical protein LP316_07060 [Thalassotalea sp. LPB0316]